MKLINITNIFHTLPILVALLFSACLQTNCISKSQIQENDTGEITVTDIDDNIYHTVTIGTQVWMIENLRTTKYNDGTEIPFIENTTEVWYELGAPGYCWYNDDKSGKEITGALYNWYAVDTGKLAPIGWHVPTDEDWTILTEYLGGEKIAGGKMKETGTAHWFSPNTGATNSSGFTALPAGFRGRTGFITLSLGNALFWSSTVFDDADSWTRYLLFDNEAVGRNNGGKYHGLSVRCVKDYGVYGLTLAAVRLELTQACPR